MDEQTKAVVTIKCPHCAEELKDVVFEFVDPGMPVRLTCAFCGEGIWLKVLGVNDDGTARIQIGVTVTPENVTDLLKECGGKCPTCGREFKASQERKYKLMPTLEIVRQGNRLTPNGIAVVIKRLCDEDVIPAVFVSRENARGSDSIVVELRWNDLEAAERGLVIYGTKIPEIGGAE